jgi:hypothetical protein
MSTAPEAILVENIAAPPPPPQYVSTYVMANEERFTREQYHAVGWSDDQLIQSGKMYVIEPAPVLISPIGMPKYKWVVLEENEDIPPTGLYVGHNGTGYLIRSGEPVRVPEHVLHVLDDAIMDAPVINPADRKVMGYRPRRRYNYREVDAPVEAE